MVATLYDTAVTIYEKIYGPLEDEAAELMYQDYARMGTVLQLPADLWPADRAAFKTYWDARMQSLELDAVAVRVGRDLLYPPTGAALAPDEHAIDPVHHRRPPARSPPERVRAAVE